METFTSIKTRENDISFDIRGAAFKVHPELGPGLLESVYETALTYELKKPGDDVKNQVGGPVTYSEIKMDIGFVNLFETFKKETGFTYKLHSYPLKREHYKDFK